MLRSTPNLSPLHITTGTSFPCVPSDECLPAISIKGQLDGRSKFTSDVVRGLYNIKDTEITGKFARSGKYDNMLRNHLEGKVAAFYAHGDDGADDYDGKELPESYQDVIDDGFSNNPKSTVMPYVMQLKYSGVFVPDQLIQAFYLNKGVNYNIANKTFDKTQEFFDRADYLLDNLLTYLEDNKNKI